MSRARHRTHELWARRPRLGHQKGAHPRENEAMRQLLELDSDITITEDVTPGREEFTSEPTVDADPDE
jgi:hypothetical protein